MAPQSCLLFCLFGALFSTSWAEGLGKDSLPLPRAPCPPGSLYYKGFCYEFLDDPDNWAYAEASCVYWRNGHLASILTPEEGNEISNYVMMTSQKSVAWIGFRGTSTSSKIRWQWSDGSLYVPGSALWDKQRPPTTTFRNEECIALINTDRPNEPKKWGQFSCASNLPYICKYRAAY